MSANRIVSDLRHLERLASTGQRMGELPAAPEDAENPWLFQGDVLIAAAVLRMLANFVRLEP